MASAKSERFKSFMFAGLTPKQGFSGELICVCSSLAARKGSWASDGLGHSKEYAT